MILAAGLGTRMKSETPKVLFEVAGRPLVCWAVELARDLEAARTVVVLGHKLELVKQVLDARYGEGAIAIARQEHMRGTGDAVRAGLAALEDAPDETPLVILAGDVPLLRAETMRRAVTEHATSPAVVVTFEAKDPTGYGRIVRQNGRVVRIVEHADADRTERLIHEVNSGAYVFQLGFVRRELSQLAASNAQGEIYLTDLIHHAAGPRRPRHRQRPPRKKSRA